MFYDDFTLTWTELDGSAILAEENFAEDQLPDEFKIFKNDSRTGNLIYIVPSDVSEFTIEFQEYWDDDFIGNTCRINFLAE